MPLGYRMGLLALEALGVPREKDHTLHVVCELGEGHPQTCLMDGIQAATGATFGKTLMEKTRRPSSTSSASSSSSRSASAGPSLRRSPPA